MGQATIFAGQKIKTLKSTLSLNGGADIISSTTNPQTSAVSAEPGSLLLNTTSGTMYRKLDAGLTTNWVEVGAGSGGKNYISNPDFDGGSTSGWSMQKVSLSSLIPTGNIGAPDAGHTIAASSSSPLEGANSLLVQGASAFTAGNCLVSKEFAIDREDQAKVMGWSFYYEAVTANMDFPGTSAGTWAVYIAEVTTATPDTVVSWIQPAGVYNLVQGSGVGIASGTFQTTATGTAYRLVLVCINSEAAATTLKVDDFKLGPQTTVQGAAISDWVSSTPTYSNAGTTSSSVHSTRRVGDTLQIQGRTVFATAGAAAVLRLRIPSSIGTIDTTKVQTGNLAGTVGSYLAQIGGSIFNGNVTLTTTANEVSFIPDGAGGSHLGSAFGLNTELTYTLSVPISGWSSNTVLSQDTDTRVVAGSFESNSFTSVASGVNTTITLGVARLDTHQAWNGTDTYTIPVSGVYSISGMVSFAANATGNRGVLVQVGGSDFVLGLGPTITTGVRARVTGAPRVFRLNAGTTVRLRGYQDGAPTLNAENFDSYLSIERLSGPATIAASETVAFRADGSTQTLTTSDATISWTAEAYDTHGAWNGNTFTAPISGVYDFTALFRSSAAVSTTTVNSGISLKYQKNSETPVRLNNFVFQVASVNIRWMVAGSFHINLIAGDTIKIVGSFDSGVSSTSLNSESFFMGYKI